MASALSNQWARLMGAAPGGPRNLAGDTAAGVCVVAWQVGATSSERSSEKAGEWVSRVWSRAQSEAGLPAPAISVDGAAGWQLWFALAQARPRAEVKRVFAHLIGGWLGEDAGPDAIASPMFHCWPDETGAVPGASGPRSGAGEPPVPRQVGPDRWSAFVAPDLVPVFVDTPWLDCEPGEEGQAALLARLIPIQASDWARLLASAGPREQSRVSSGAQVPLTGEAGVQPAQAAQAFLLSVMNDERAELALRIEAARVLLAHG